MTRKPKALGLALVAMFAMSTVGASTASAADDMFRSEASPVTWTGSQSEKLKFTIASQVLECETPTFHATVTGTSVGAISGITPFFTGPCTYAGEEATITPNGCTFTLSGTTDGNNHGAMSTVCPGTQLEITLKAIGCIVKIAQQTATEGIKYTNFGILATKEVGADLTAKFKVTSAKDPNEGITCASLKNGTALITGSIKFTGEDKVTNIHRGIWFE